jgi:hypothetical protein
MSQTEGVRRAEAPAGAEQPQVATGLAWLAVWLLRVAAGLILAAPAAGLAWWLLG